MMHLMTKRLLHEVDDEAGDLGRQHAEIVGDKDKENAGHKAPAVFNEIFFEVPEVLHNRGLGKGKLRRLAD
jgi:hypothetical protein